MNNLKVPKSTNKKIGICPEALINHFGIIKTHQNPKAIILPEHPTCDNLFEKIAANAWRPDRSLSMAIVKCVRLFQNMVSKRLHTTVFFETEPQQMTAH